MGLGERYKDLRESLIENNNPIGVNQFSKIIGIPSSRISELENDKRTITMTELKKYYKLFNVTTDYLLGLSDVKTTDTDIKSVCNYTGLSEEAVKALNIDYKVEFEQYIIIRNWLIAYELNGLVSSFWSVYESSTKYVNHKEMLKQDFENYSRDEQNKLLNKNDDMLIKADFCRYMVQKVVEGILNKLDARCKEFDCKEVIEGFAKIIEKGEVKGGSEYGEI